MVLTVIQIVSNAVSVLGSLLSMYMICRIYADTKSRILAVALTIPLVPFFIVCLCGIIGCFVSNKLVVETVVSATRIVFILSFYVMLWMIRHCSLLLAKGEQKAQK